MSQVPTIRKIASVCGCNNSTVSRALNNHPAISKATRDRVMAAAHELGWKRNPMAAAYMAHLASTRPPQYQANLGWVIAHAPGKVRDLNPMHREVFEGAQARAKAMGYKLELISLHDLENNVGRFGHMLKSRGIFGFVVHGTECMEQMASSFDWQSFAVATWGYTIPTPRIHRAAYNMAHGIRMALGKLHEYGYRRIGMVISDEYDQIVNHGFFYPFYYEQMRPARGEWRGHCAFSMKDKNLKTKISRWLERYKPEVIFGEDIVWKTIQEMGWKVPADVAYVSVSWYPEWPHIGGIAQRLDIAAANAVDLVAAQLAHNELGIPAIPKLFLHEGDWIDGDSVPPLNGKRS